MGCIDKNLRANIRRILTEQSIFVNGFVIVNRSPRNYDGPPPIFFDNKTEDFTSYLPDATVFEQKESAFSEISKVKLNHPEYDLSVFTVDLADSYYQAFKKIHSIKAKSN